MQSGTNINTPPTIVQPIEHPGGNKGGVSVAPISAVIVTAIIAGRTRRGTNFEAARPQDRCIVVRLAVGSAVASGI